MTERNQNEAINSGDLSNLYKYLRRENVDTILQAHFKTYSLEKNSCHR